MSDNNPFAEYMKLLRLWNGLIAILGMLLGVAVAIGLSEIENFIDEMILGAIVVIFFVGAGNSINDYFDVETDKIAHPNRPLVRGSLSKKTALYSSIIMFVICIILGVFLNLISLLIIVLAIVAMFVYELRLKDRGFVGNILIALLVFGLFEFAGSIVGKWDVTLILASLSALATLGREIIKDIEDVKGDVGRRTLPMILGERKAGYVAMVPTAIAVGLSPLPYIEGQLTTFYILVVLIADALFIYGAWIQLKNPRKGQKIFKVAMIVALIAFAVGVQI
ncbi:MAG: UbiA family prenyltransferase [Thermoplasmata archaeon]|nr:UbiA family prenyltransferase [Thermoplasmata archaeon]